MNTTRGGATGRPSAPPAAWTTSVSEHIGAGSLFDVRLSREGGREVVEKRILPRFVREPEARASLVREAQILAALKHRAVPELVRVGSDELGPYLVETFVAGASIRRIVESWSSRGGVPGRLAGHLARQAFSTLAELSGLAGPTGPLDFVHGDIGPDHVVLDPAGDVRLLDFGASRIATLPPSLISEGRGTLPFVAPEIARGDAPPSHAGDVYALAATALFLGCGQPICAAREEAAILFEVGTQGVRTALLASTPYRPSERDALARALAVDPSVRIRDARTMADVFDR